MDEPLKTRLLVSFAAFNVVFFVYQIAMNWQGSGGGYGIAFLLGAAAAGIAYGAMMLIGR
jgi:hypothetical protein